MMPAPLVVIGNADSRRVMLLQAARAQLDQPPAHVVTYVDLLAGRVVLSEVVTTGSVVRIESPGKDFAVEQALLVLGADVPDDEPFARLSAKDVRQLPFERGRMLPSRQWFLGFRAALALISRQLAACPPHALMNHPDDIATMFDKRACHTRLAEAGVPVPRSLGPVQSYAELIAAMREARCWRVFVKLAHGSSASGAVAYQVSSDRHHATTTVEMVRSNGELRLYNSRRLRVLCDAQEIAALIDALCRQRIHVEQWIPKASIGGKAFDLRVVVIGGRAQHVVVRASHTPMTNLHLLNERGDLGAVRARMGERAWIAALATCERAMSVFARSLYAGVDLLVGTSYQRHAILEINAFGDLLPGVLHNGNDTYTAEILAQTQNQEPRTENC